MDKQEIFELVERVVRWEIHAQAGVGRPVDQWPALIADTLLDHFTITPLPDTPTIVPADPHLYDDIRSS